MTFTGEAGEADRWHAQSVVLKERQPLPWVSEKDHYRKCGASATGRATTYHTKGRLRSTRYSLIQDLNVQASRWCMALLKGHLGLVPYLFQPYSNAYVLDGF